MKTSVWRAFTERPRQQAVKYCRFLRFLAVIYKSIFARRLLYRGVLQVMMMAYCAAQTSSAPSPAQDVSNSSPAGPIPRENVVVTVTGEALPISASSASVTVLSKQLIQESAAANAADLLRQVPFLYLSQAGGRGGLTTVTLRGAKPNLVLVMIDGVPVTDNGW